MKRKFLALVAILALVVTIIPILVVPVSVGATGTLTNVYNATTQIARGNVWATTIVGDFWYVTDDSEEDSYSSLLIYNITDATSPDLVGEWNYTTGGLGAFCGLYVVDDLAYIGEWYSKLVFCVNVTDKTSPTYISNYTTPVVGPYNIQGNGTHMWVVTLPNSGTGYLECVDISTPGTMTVLGNASFAGSTVTCGGLAITDDSLHAFVSVPDMHIVYAFNISADAPVIASNISTPVTGSLSHVHSMDALGDVLYVDADWIGNLTFIDISDVNSMSVLSTVHYAATQTGDTQDSYKLHVREYTGATNVTYLFVVPNGGAGQTPPFIQCWDVTNPLYPTQAGYDSPYGNSSYSNCYPDGDYLYCAHPSYDAVEEVVVSIGVSITVDPSTYAWGTVSANHNYTTPINGTFSITNNGNVAVDVTIEATDFVGSPISWTLSGTGAPGYATYGLWVWRDYDYLVVNSTAQLLVFLTNINPGVSEGFGFKFCAPTGGLGSNSLANNVTFVATQHS